MSIDAMQNTPNAVSFGEEQQKQKKSTMATPGFVLGAAGGATTGYYAFKTPISYEKLAGLTDDKFDKAFKDPKDENVVTLKKQLAAVKNVDDAAGKKIAEDFPNATKDGKINVDKVLVEDYLKSIKQESGESLATALKTAQDKAAGLAEAVKGKEGDEKTKAEKAVDENKATIDKLTEQKAVLDSAVEVKDGEKSIKQIEVSKIKEGVVKELKAEAEKTAKTTMESIKDLPKVHSGKIALIGAGIGAVLFGLIGHFIGGSKPAEAAPEAAPEAPAKPEAQK